MTKKGKAFLVLLLLFSSAVFFLGWTQIRIKPDTIGIVVSRTNGISSNVAESGKFSWHWQFLIPKNAELRSFSILPYNFKKTVEGFLPSSDVIGTAVQGKPDFSYMVELSVSLSISPEGIIKLMQEGKITDQKSLDSFMERKSDDFSQYTQKAVFEKFSEDLPKSSYYIEPKDILGSGEFFDENEDIRVLELTVLNQNVPDYGLYRQARKGMIDSIEKGFEVSAEKTSSENLDDEEKKAFKNFIQFFKNLSDAGSQSSEKKGDGTSPENQ